MATATLKIETTTTASRDPIKVKDGTQIHAPSGIKETIPTNREHKVGNNVVHHGGDRIFSNEQRVTQTRDMNVQTKEADPALATG